MSAELQAKFDALQAEVAQQFRRLAWRTDQRFYRLMKTICMPRKRA